MDGTGDPNHNARDRIIRPDRARQCPVRIDDRSFDRSRDMSSGMSVALPDSIKQFMIVHAGDDRMIARRILLALHRSEIPAHQVPGAFRYVFRLAHFITVFEYLLVYLITTGGPLPDPRWITNSPRTQALYPQIGNWLRRCFVENQLAMPPVSETQGMVFIDTVLDGAEAHLLSLRESSLALRVSEMRRKVDEIWRKAGSQWVLSSTFSSNIGHFVYAATLKTLRDGRYLPAPPIVMLRGTTRNPALRRYFEFDMIEDMPDGILYAEMISARKRHQTSTGRVDTMSQLVSEAARRWTGGAPFLRLDHELRSKGDETLSALGVSAGRPIVTLHVREQGYNENTGSLMRLRDADIRSYGPAVRELADAGFAVVRLGDASMSPATDIDGLLDYPFTGAKSDWMDIYLAGRCAFHIGTSSGMSFVPLLLGRPVLFSNWPTLEHAVCAPAVMTLPKVLRTVAGQTVPLETFFREHGHILEASDAILHGLEFADNDPRDLRDAAVMMASHLDRVMGTVTFPAGLFDRAAAVAATSRPGVPPQIPNWFLDRHYGAGSS